MYTSQQDDTSVVAAQKGQKLQINLNDVLEDMFMVLSEKERDIVVQRFGLDNKAKRTLEFIGQKFSITRERVRQIENIALNKLKRIMPNTSLRLLNEVARSVLRHNGGAMLEDSVVSQVLLQLDKPEEVDGFIIRLALNIDHQLVKQEKSFQFHPFWYESSIPREAIDAIFQTSFALLNSKGNVISEEELVAAVLQKLHTKYSMLEAQTISSSLAADKRFKKSKDSWGLMEWRHVNPKSIRDKAYIILKEAGEPLHFVEIANRILNRGFDRKTVTTQAVHNELIRYEQFVLVGRGLYALKEWGYKSGTVADVIEDILVKSGKPMRKQDIINAVLKQRTVKLGTISLNLQNCPQFVRVGRAVYTFEPKKKK